MKYILKPKRIFEQHWSLPPKPEPRLSPQAQAWAPARSGCWKKHAAPRTDKRSRLEKGSCGKRGTGPATRHLHRWERKARAVVARVPSGPITLAGAIPPWRLLVHPRGQPGHAGSTSARTAPGGANPAPEWRGGGEGDGPAPLLPSPAAATRASGPRPSGGGGCPPAGRSGAGRGGGRTIGAVCEWRRGEWPGRRGRGGAGGAGIVSPPLLLLRLSPDACLCARRAAVASSAGRRAEVSGGVPAAEGSARRRLAVRGWEEERGTGRHRPGSPGQTQTASPVRCRGALREAGGPGTRRLTCTPGPEGGYTVPGGGSRRVCTGTSAGSGAAASLGSGRGRGGNGCPLKNAGRGGWTPGAERAGGARGGRLRRAPRAVGAAGASGRRLSRCPFQGMLRGPACFVLYCCLLSKWGAEYVYFHS